MKDVVFYIAGVQALAQITTVVYLLKISKVRLTKARPWQILAVAFSVSAVRRVFTFISLSKIAGQGINSIIFIDQLVVPFISNILIMLAFVEIYISSKEQYRKFLKTKND